MSRKILGILVMTLLIGTAVLPVIGTMNEKNVGKEIKPILSNNAVQSTTDGGYIIAGYTKSFGEGNYDIWLIKTDADGNKIWDKTYGGSDDDSGGPLCVQQTSDDGYIIGGRTKSFGAGKYDVWLIKTDADGTKVWDKTFGGSGEDGSHSVRQTTDGGYIIAGGTQSFGAGDYDIWLIKTDSEGNKMWDKTYGGSNIDWGVCVQSTTDGGYIIVGTTDSFGDIYDFDVWLVKIDTNGNEIWNRTFGGNRIENGLYVRQTADGGYIASGKTSSFGAGGDDAWLIKVDANGNEIWNKTYGGSKQESGEIVQQIADGGYVIEGRTNSYGEGNYDTWLVKTDADGNEIWNTTFGGAENDQGTCVQQTTDEGYIIGGFTKSFGEGNYDVLLVKTDRILQGIRKLDG